MEQPVRVSMNRVTTRAAKTPVRWASMVVASDHEVRSDGCAVRAGGEARDVALQPGSVPCPGLELAVEALDRARPRR
jgi:hypothetical protein